MSIIEPALMTYIGAVIGVIGAVLSGIGTIQRKGHKKRSCFILAGVAVSIIGSLVSATGAYFFSQQQTIRSGEMTELYKQIAFAQQSLREKADTQADAQSELKNKSDEIAALNREIASAQKELRKRSDENAALITGGDSFCYLDFMSNNPLSTHVFVAHRGKYPIYDVSIRIVDIDAPVQYRNVADVLKNQVVFHVGNLAPNQGKPFPNNVPKKSQSNSYRFNIFISSRNGYFIELLRFSKVNGEWKVAMKVQRDAPINNNLKEPLVLLENVDPDFPRNEKGQVHWE